MGMLPGMGGLGIDQKQMQKAMDQVDDKKLAHTEAIIMSMTPEERENPKLINPSRKHRIAKGAGLDIAEVNRFIKQFEQSKKMMKQMSGMMKGKRGKMKLPFGGF
jgi:signal recognition particle subunit SRP54